MQKYNRVLAKLGNDGFSLALFRTKVADSKEFCKMSNKRIIMLVYIMLPFTFLNANECRGDIGYADYSTDKIVKYYSHFIVYQNDTLPIFQKHMREILNKGNYSFEIYYDDIVGSHVQIIKKGKGCTIFGELKRITCLGVENIQRDENLSTTLFKFTKDNYP